MKLSLSSYILIVTIFILSSICFSQEIQLKEILPNGWQRFEISEIGSIDIPPTIELQDKEKNPILSAANQDAIYFQQKGLNDLSKDAFKTYVRVILENQIFNPGEVETLDSRYYLSSEELSELDNILKPQYENQFTRIINWFPIELVDVNNIRALKIHYTRVGNNKDKLPVDVKIYKFQNYDRIHSLTLTHRLKDANKWNNILDDILNSFEITNNRKPQNFNNSRISKEYEKGAGKIILFLFFIPLYAIIRVLKWKFTKKIPSDELINKLTNSVKRCGGYAIAWGIIQIIGAIVLLSQLGIYNLIGMIIFSTPVIISGYLIFREKHKSSKPFLVIFIFMIFFILILPFLLVGLLGDEGMHWFDISGFSIFHFGPSWLTLLLGYFSVSGWISSSALQKITLLKSDSNNNSERDISEG